MMARGKAVRGIPIVLLASISLSACNGEGPRTNAILNSPEAAVVKADTAEAFALIEVNRGVATAVSRGLDSRRYSGFFSQKAAGEVVIGVGDTLAISIVSASNTGFVDFASNSLNPVSAASLPPQEVSSGGTVNVPPLGRLLAQGKTVQDFENFVTSKLGEVLVDPSVIVRLEERKSARATVVGEVRNPGPVSLSTTDTRLIDMITAAGGPVKPSQDLDVTLIRKGRSATIRMDQLYKTPAYNISALPGDVISIDPPIRKITVLGAVSSNASFRFEEPSVSLADALGRFGGLLNERAALRGIFVYRDTPRATLLGLGADISDVPGDMVPTIFIFDFTQPTALFTAREFQIADGDILYVSESTLSEINSVISALSPWVGTPYSAYGSELQVN